MNPTRQEIIKVIEEFSLLFPDMRFGQIVVNMSNIATRRPDAVYEVEDKDFLSAARDFLQRQTKRISETTTAKAG